MKYTLVIVFILSATSIFAQQTKGAFTVSGIVKGQDTGTISFSYTGQDDKWTTGQATLKNGHFSFKGAISEPNRCFISGKTKNNSISDPNLMEFFFITWADQRKTDKR